MASNTIQMNISSIDLSYIKKNTMDIEINKIGTLIREQRISRGIIQKKLGDKEGITKDIIAYLMEYNNMDLLQQSVYFIIRKHLINSLMKLQDFILRVQQTYMKFLRMKSKWGKYHKMANQVTCYFSNQTKNNI